MTKGQQEVSPFGFCNFDRNIRISKAIIAKFLTLCNIFINQHRQNIDTLPKVLSQPDTLRVDGAIIPECHKSNKLAKGLHFKI